jgi:hypothetical protein
MALTKIPSSLLDTSGGFDLQGNITLGDNEQIQLGASGDLAIYHNGTDSWIQEAGTGNLNIKSNGTFINFLDGSNNLMAYMVPGGAIGLYHNTSKKFETSSAGATVTGTLTVTGDLDITGDINSYNVTDLDVTDQTITLGAGQTEANSGGSGIIVDGSNASILWDETTDGWVFNKQIGVNADDCTTASSLSNIVVGEYADTSSGIVLRGTTASALNFEDNSSVTAARVYYNHASGYMAFNTEQTERLRIDSSGNVGISNTSTLNANLHIGSASATGNATNPALQIGGSTTYRLGMFTTAEGGVIDNANGDDGLQFHTKNAGEAVRITANGNLQMIGQTSSFANPGFTYHTNNYLYLRGGSAGLILADDSNANTIQIIDGASGYINFETGDGSSRMRIDSSGNVAIGPHSPLRTLHVNSGSTNVVARLESTDGIAAIEFKDSAGSAEVGCNGNDVVFFPAGAEKARLTSGGNLGIGTLSSSGTENLIHAKGTNNSAGDLGTAVGPGNIPAIHIQNAGTTDNNMAAIFFMDDASVRAGVHARFISHGSDDAELRLSTSAGGNLRERMVIDKDGNVGIGTSNPDHKLHVDVGAPASTDKTLAAFSSERTLRDIGFVWDDSESTLGVATLTDHHMAFHTNGNSSERMRITNGGNVGIGTNNPGNKLTVDAGTFAGYMAEFIQGGGGGGNHGPRIVSGSASSYAFIVRANASTVFYVDGSGNYYFSGSNQSDINKKENIADITDNALDLITQLEPKTYNFIGNDKDKAGFVAQDMENVIPLLVTGNEYDPEAGPNPDENPTGKGIDYMGYTAYLTKAIQELKEELDAAKARITELEG